MFAQNNAQNNLVVAHAIASLRRDATVVTHYGDDLDNRASIHALALSAGLSPDEVEVVRVPAGTVKAGMVNVDTGGHAGPDFRDDGTIVIDGGDGYRSAIAVLADAGLAVPAQIVELADAGADRDVDILDARSGLALLRYVDTTTLFRLAKAELLDRTLTDEQLVEYGLVEAAAKQAGVVLAAAQAVASGLVQAGPPALVIVDCFVPAGSQVAYRLYGRPTIYASIAPHREGDGVTFSVVTNADELPEKLVDGLLAFEDRTAGEGSIFRHPNGQMVVAGGPKVPDFRVLVDAGDVRAVITDYCGMYVYVLDVMGADGYWGSFSTGRKLFCDPVQACVGLFDRGERYELRSVWAHDAQGDTVDGIDGPGAAAAVVRRGGTVETFWNFVSPGERSHAAESSLKVSRVKVE